MSSLAAARADNFYYPREWRPEHGTLNQLHHSASTRKQGDGAQVVRFEMPFDVRCTHCDASIGRGVRFNARKRRCGAYLSTPLYAFALTCPDCKGPMQVETDPEHRTYRLVSGVRKKMDAADVVAAAPPTNSGDKEAQHDVLDTTERLNDPQVTLQLRTDPFFRLEHEHNDKRIARQRTDRLDALLQLRDTRDSDSYAANAGLRAHFRWEKQQRDQRTAAGARLGLSVPLLDASEADVLAAKAVVYNNLPGKQKRLRENKNSSRSGTNNSLQSRDRHGSDSFQHFGDPLGSQLHRLKRAKVAQKQSQAARGQVSMTSTSEASKRRVSGSSHNSALSVDARARKLLRR